MDREPVMALTFELDHIKGGGGQNLENIIIKGSKKVGMNGDEIIKEAFYT